MERSLIAAVKGALAYGEETQAITLDRVREAILRDEKLSALREALVNTSHELRLPEELEEFDRYRDRLSIMDNVIMYNRRVVIPSSLRKEVLQGLHAAHQGVSGMQARAEQTVFWPGIYKDLVTTREACRECNIRAPSQAALPPKPLPQPEYPFHMIVADYCTIKAKTWLVVADRFTGWVSVHYFPREATALQLVDCLKLMFVTFGVPEILATDHGSQFRAAEMEKFLKTWGVHHRVSSDYNPHSNLRAEVAVKTTKRMLLTSTKADGSPIWNNVYCISGHAPA